MRLMFLAGPQSLTTHLLASGVSDAKPSRKSSGRPVDTISTCDVMLPTVSFARPFLETVGWDYYGDIGSFAKMREVLGIGERGCEVTAGGAVVEVWLLTEEKDLGKGKRVRCDICSTGALTRDSNFLQPSNNQTHILLKDLTHLRTSSPTQHYSILTQPQSWHPSRTRRLTN
jgi:hypothetical protein